MSLVSLAGTGSTWSVQGVDVGVGVGGSRGVVAVEVILSMCFTAKGEATSEFTWPLASERGGIEIQSPSFSLGL